MRWFRILLPIFLLVGMLFCVNSIAYADDPPDDDPEMKVDIEVDGDLEVDIDASGPAELKVGVEGPSEVHIDVDDEVKLKVEASDESEVIVNEQKLADDDNTSGLNSHLPIISGALLAVGLPMFFLIRRRKAKKG